MLFDSNKKSSIRTCVLWKKNCSVQKDINHFAHFCTVPCLYRPRFAKFRASALLIIGKLSCFFILGKTSLWMWQGFYTYRNLLIFIYLLTKIIKKCLKEEYVHQTFSFSKWFCPLCTWCIGIELPSYIFIYVGNST